MSSRFSILHKVALYFGGEFCVPRSADLAMEISPKGRKEVAKLLGIPSVLTTARRRHESPAVVVFIDPTAPLPASGTVSTTRALCNDPMHI